MAYIGAEPVPGQNREVDDISSGFNGNATAFTLQVSSVNVSPESANNILINLGGVLQNPGTDYTIAASTITFTTAPASGLSFFGLILGAGINTATVADQTIGTSKVLDNAITADKLAHTSVTAGSYTTADITVDAQGRITAAANGTIAQSEIANDAVGADQLASNAVVNDSVASNAAIAGTKISPDFGSQNIATTGSATIGSDLIHAGDTDTKIGFGTDTISLTTNNVTRMTFTGNFIDLPDAGTLRLGNSNDLQISHGSGGASNIVHSNTSQPLNISATGAGNIAFLTNSNERVRIDSSGNVGIGTTSPSVKLECVGTAKVKDNTGFTVQATTASTTGKLTIIGVNSNSQISAISRLKSVSTDSNSGGSALTFETRTTGNAMVERMRILANGDIGIGTVNPTTGLHVNGTTRVTELLVNVSAGHNSSRVHIQGHSTGSHTNLRCANSNGTQLFLVRNDNAAFFGGSVSKGSGSFFIDHPLPSLAATKTLRHSFIEGPQCDNIYRGKVTLSSGTASINIDTVSKMTEGTFVVLNRDVQCFTSNETSYTGVKGSVSGNILTITSEDNSSTDTISWMVVGERQDPNIKASTITDDDGYLLVEEDKVAE